MDSDADDREPLIASAEPDSPSSDAPKTPARKPAARKAPVRKPPAAKPTEARPTSAKAPVTKAPAAAAPVAKAPVAKAPATKAPAKKPPAKRTPAKKAPAAKTPPKSTSASLPAQQPARETVLVLEGLSKHFDTTFAVDSVTLSVASGTIFGIVGPNGAGKTTTLSMVTGLLRPDAGTVHVHGADVWADPATAKRNMGVLPDRLRLFDRLTGGQLLYYSGILRGLSGPTVKSRSADLAVAFGLEDALDRLVADYSAGMTKKIALAAAMIHSPRLLILDEPFESVDPVSAANIIEILQKYTTAGGTVVMSSHSMDLIQRICDSVAIIVGGKVLVSGTMEQVRGAQSLEARFVELAGGRRTAEGMEWLHSFSD